MATKMFTVLFQGQVVTLTAYEESPQFTLVAANGALLAASQVQRVIFKDFPGHGGANITTAHGTPVSIEEITDLKTLREVWARYEAQPPRPHG